MSVVPDNQHETELFVIDAIRDGDRYAFEELVRRHNPFVRSVIVGVLGDTDRVDDVAQQVWASFWEQIEKLRDTSRWRPWLYRLARNAAIDAGRSVTRRRNKEQAVREQQRSAAGVPPPEKNLIGEEQRKRVLQAVESLPALYREPFVLKHLNDWSYQQIGEVMGLPVDTVETRLVRARRLLREALKAEV